MSNITAKEANSLSEKQNKLTVENLCYWIREKARIGDSCHSIIFSRKYNSNDYLFEVITQIRDLGYTVEFEPGTDYLMIRW